MESTTAAAIKCQRPRRSPRSLTVPGTGPFALGVGVGQRDRLPNTRSFAGFLRLPCPPPSSPTIASAPTGKGRSGLGLEAQQKSVRDCLNGGHIAAEFVEIETGKRNDRPELRIAVRPAALKDALKRSL